MSEKLAVRRGLKQTAVKFKMLAYLVGIDNVTIVRQRKIAAMVTESEWLNILDSAHVGCGVAHVSDGDAARQSIEILFVEHLAHKPDAFHGAHLPAVDCDNAAPLLPTVLKAVQRIVGQLRGILNTVNPKNSALVMNTHKPNFYWPID